MKTKITPDEFFKLFGELMFGLNDMYYSLTKCRAGHPFVLLKGKLGLLAGGMGDPKAGDLEQAARAIFADQAINIDLLEACKAARDLWGSNSASLDFDDVNAMLTDAIEKAEKSPAERLASLSAAYNVILLAVALLEDGAPKTALELLRQFSDECETLEIEKEKS